MGVGSYNRTVTPKHPTSASPPATPDRGGYVEAMRATAELADVAARLLPAMFPEKRFVSAMEGGWVTFAARPALALQDSRRLLDHLHDLVARPEWRRLHAVAREVTDTRGRRVEVQVPLPPEAYEGGEAVVGPFPDEESAKAWYAGVQVHGLAADTVCLADAWLCDLFLLSELLDD